MKNRLKPVAALVIIIVILLSAWPLLTASDVDLPFNTVQWPGFRGSDDNNAVISAKTPRTAAETKLNWAYTLKDADDYATFLSDPILVQDNLYIVVGDELLVLDRVGQLLDQTALAGHIDYTCRPLYLDDLIIIPLSNGRLQALASDTLDTAWTTDALKAYDMNGLQYDHQSMTTLTGANGYLYRGTVCVDLAESFFGVYQCINLADGSIQWTYTNQSAGYYWSGAVLCGGSVLFAGDDGMLTSLDALDGTELDRLDLGAAVRTTLVREGNKVLAVSTDGKLHVVTVAADGTLGGHKSVSFAASSTSTPALYGRKAVVGGQLSQSEGLLCVIDLDTMAVTQSVSTPAGVQSSPLLATGYSGKVYAYYTVNTTPGGLYVLKLGAAQADAQPLNVPAEELQNYCIASAIADRDGNLYYTNDSGRLFSIGLQKDPEEVSITLDQTSAILLRKASYIRR